MSSTTSQTKRHSTRGADSGELWPTKAFLFQSAQIVGFRVLVSPRPTPSSSAVMCEVVLTRPGSIAPDCTMCEQVIDEELSPSTRTCSKHLTCCSTEGTPRQPYGRESAAGS